jgi:hypothetical protein
MFAIRNSGGHRETLKFPNGRSIENQLKKKENDKRSELNRETDSKITPNVTEMKQMQETASKVILLRGTALLLPFDRHRVDNSKQKTYVYEV